VAHEQRQHEQESEERAKEQDLHCRQLVAEMLHHRRHYDQRHGAGRDKRGRACDAARRRLARSWRATHCGRCPSCATAAEAPRLTPMMRKIPPTPVAAAIRPARTGITNWPMRLPIMRSELAVPRVSSLVIASSVAILTVMALLSAKPAAAITSTIAQSGSGSAS